MTSLSQLPEDILIEIQHRLPYSEMMKMRRINKEIQSKTANSRIRWAQRIFADIFDIDISKILDRDEYFIVNIARRMLAGMDIQYHRDIYTRLLENYLSNPKAKYRDIFEGILDIVNRNDIEAVDDFYEENDIMMELINMNPLQIYLYTGLSELFSYEHDYFPNRFRGAQLVNEGHDPYSILYYPDLQKQIYSRDISLKLSRRDYVYALDRFVKSMIEEDGSGIAAYVGIFEAILYFLRSKNLDQLSDADRATLKRFLLTYGRLREGDYDGRTEFFSAALSVLFIDSDLYFH